MRLHPGWSALGAGGVCIARPVVPGPPTRVVVRAGLRTSGAGEVWLVGVVADTHLVSSVGRYGRGDTPHGGDATQTRADELPERSSLSCDPGLRVSEALGGRSLALTLGL